jgi:hypothetical protein
MGLVEADSTPEPAHEAQAETAADVDPAVLMVMA